MCAGYFSLNVPSGLALYWFVNNILSTSQQAWLKSTYGQDDASLPGASTIAAADKAEEERLQRVKQLTGVCFGIIPECIQHHINKPCVYAWSPLTARRRSACSASSQAAHRYRHMPSLTTRRGIFQNGPWYPS